MHKDTLWVSKPIYIIAELVHRVSHLPCVGRNLWEIMAKINDVGMIKRLKKTYKLTKGTRGYFIDSISDNAVQVATQLLAGKVMRKCRSSEVPAIVIALAEECAIGVRFNWSQFICEEFLANYCKVQEEGKSFYYAWLLLSLMLVTTEFPEDNQFPVLTPEWSEAAQYASLWEIKDAHRIQGIRIFWVLMNTTIRQWINVLPCLKMKFMRI